MRMPWARTSPVDDEPVPAEEAPVFGNSWTMGDRLAARGVSVVLWAGIVCGPVALALWGWQAGSPAPAVTVSASVDAAAVAQQQLAEEFGVRVVTTWLTASRGQEDLVRALLPQASSISLPARGLGVAEAMVAGSRPAGVGVWSVTVAATVSDERTVSRRFFEIPVKVDGQTVTAIALPGEVPSSLLAGAAADLDYPALVAANSPLYTTSTEFLSAFLAGQGDVSRIISPDSEIRAVSPAPFTSVKVTGIAAHDDVPATPAEGDELDVLVSATASSGEQTSVGLQYALTLTVRAGRWEVLAIRDVPLLSNKQPGASAEPSRAPAQTVTPQPTPTTTPSGGPTQQ